MHQTALFFLCENLCPLLGFGSCGCNARPVWSYQLHPSTTSSPSLYVSLVLGVSYSASGLESIPSWHWWCEVWSVNAVASSFVHLRIIVCLLLSKVSWNIRSEYQWHSEVQQYGQSSQNPGRNATSPTPGSNSSWYPWLVQRADTKRFCFRAVDMLHIHYRPRTLETV